MKGVVFVCLVLSVGCASKPYTSAQHQAYRSYLGACLDVAFGKHPAHGPLAGALTAQCTSKARQYARM